MRQRRGLASRLSAGGIALLLAACGGRGVHTPASPEIPPPPSPAETDAVLFLVGDPGDAILSVSPVLARIREEVEWWSGRVDPGSAVAVVVLGDILYPEGMHGPDSPEYGRDTTIVMSQVRLVSGPNAVARGAPIYFNPGNHDWGPRRDWEGAVRLRNLDEFLTVARNRTGANAMLVPAAGTGGPVVIDRGGLRLVILETAWWLLESDESGKSRVLEAVEEAFATAGDREIVILTHHPFRSGGPHGGGISIWEALGLRYILSRSGAILQDVTSRPYRDLEAGLRAIFTEYGPPLAFIGGHDHSLQVLDPVRATDPRTILVSGSASKLSEISASEGLVFGQSAPGYMRLILEKDGDASVFVEATEREYLGCPAEDPARATCMAEGMAAFRAVYWRELR